MALTGGTARTVLQLVAPAGIILAVQDIKVTFDGTSATAVPVIITVLRQTTAGTMTARTPLKTKDTSTALQSTGQETATVEPTAGDVLDTFHVPPTSGAIYTLPIQEGEYEVPGGGRLGVRMNAPANVNTLCVLKGEE